MLIELFQHRIVLDEGCQALGRARHRKAGVEHVAEIAGVAHQMAGRDHRRIRGGDGRIDRMAVREVDAGVADAGECRGPLGRHRCGPKAVSDEQDDILLRPGWQRAREHRDDRAND